MIEAKAFLLASPVESEAIHVSMVPDKHRLSGERPSHRGMTVVV